MVGRLGEGICQPGPFDSALLEHRTRGVHGSFLAHAQRLVVKTEGSDGAKWHLAYAWAWGGLLPPAATELDEIESRRSAPHGNGEAPAVSAVEPAWVRLTRAYSQFDRAAIQRVMDEEATMRPWGAVLRFTIASFERNERDIRADARDLGEYGPAACTLLGDLSVHGSVTNLSIAALQSLPSYFCAGSAACRRSDSRPTTECARGH